MKFETKTQGGAEVQCEFEVDSDGDIDGLVITYKGVVLNGESSVLSDDECCDIGGACLAHYIKDAEDRKYDTQIDDYIESQEAA